MFESPDKHIQEVDEGKLNEGTEHSHEADDDENIQRCSITNLLSNIIFNIFQWNMPFFGGA